MEKILKVIPEQDALFITGGINYVVHVAKGKVVLEEPGIIGNVPSKSWKELTGQISDSLPQIEGRKGILELFQEPAYEVAFASKGYFRSTNLVDLTAQESAEVKKSR